MDSRHHITTSAPTAPLRPDVSGLLELSGTINTASTTPPRERRHRLQLERHHGGINVAPTTSSAPHHDSAYWTANTFLPLQFSQVTLTALNGTTDFPAWPFSFPARNFDLGYGCVEDTPIFSSKPSTSPAPIHADERGVDRKCRRHSAPRSVAGDSTQTVLNCYKNAATTPL